MKERTRFWIGLTLVKGIGPVRLNALLEVFGDARTAWLAAPEELRSAGLSDRLIRRLTAVRHDVDLNKKVEELERKGVRTLTWEDKAYPDRLRHIPQSPPVLYLLGQLQPEDDPGVAVVGTRRCTSYGRQAAEETAAVLARAGITVISGLARGIDGTAHRAALDNGGRTLAVLGSGVDCIYPPEHRGLAREIIRRGAVLSDYPLGTAPEGINFPPRNRIISGLADLVVVIEAGERSGALITANYAADQGRDVFALPGNIYAPKSKGTNQLLRQGAQPLTAPEDILELLDITRGLDLEPSQQVLPANAAEASLFRVLEREPLHVDEICSRVDLPVSQVTSTLTVMELKGLVQKTGRMTYRARQKK